MIIIHIKFFQHIRIHLPLEEMLDFSTMNALFFILSVFFGILQPSLHGPAHTVLVILVKYLDQQS